jgi:eukaryotic-like serine/threonine-protein kinase
VSLRLLILDEDRAFRAWLGHRLAEAYPSALVLAHDPSAGGALPPGFEAAHWDLVFLAHRFADRDGLEWLGELKARPQCPPVVMLLPTGDREAVHRALAAGADDYLVRGETGEEQARRVAREALRGGRRGLAAPTLPASAGGAPADGIADFRLKGHRMLRALGRGSSAAVYLMEHERSGRQAVVKVFRPRPGQRDVLAPLQRFLREYEVVSGIRHPGVVQIFDLGIADEMAFIAMEYFPGGHLGRRLGGGLPVLQALDLAEGVAHALGAVHAVGVLHRDLKPANIMLRDDGSPVLIDFGVAKLRDAPVDRAAPGEIFGTAYYMSPEQGEGAAVDERTDIYSLGVLLHEMLTGRRPYVAGSPMAVLWKHRHAPLPRLPEPLADCQPLLSRMMAKDPAERLRSAGEVLDEVAALRASVRRDEPAASGEIAG